MWISTHEEAHVILRVIPLVSLHDDCRPQHSPHEGLIVSLDKHTDATVLPHSTESLLRDEAVLPWKPWEN